MKIEKVERIPSSKLFVLTDEMPEEKRMVVLQYIADLEQEAASLRLQAETFVNGVYGTVPS